jgi:hypothetical protein
MVGTKRPEEFYKQQREREKAALQQQLAAPALIQASEPQVSFVFMVRW